MNSKMLKSCKRCNEIDKNIIPVPGEGSFDSPICILGRSPGIEENAVNRPFVGRAGRKLTAVLEYIGLSRKDVYITNVVKCFTNRNIPPSRQCLLTCSRTWLDRELMEMTNLRLVVTLGNQALKYFEPLGTVGQLHGTYFQTQPTWCAQSLELFVSYHPSAALRNLDINRHFFGDFQKLKEILEDEKLL